MSILKNETKWEDLYYYRKSLVLYQMTVAFCRRFMPKYGDRTVNQMTQAARSGKQNIVEGLADGVTSTEMELKLLNVARSSIKELKEDYLDYITSHSLPLWDRRFPRYDNMLMFCRSHNDLPDYERHFERWNPEEMANCAVTLCHMVGKMLTTTLDKKQRDFIENGGIRERMTASRLGRRHAQNEEIFALKRRIAQLEAENTALKARLRELGLGS